MLRNIFGPSRAEIWSQIAEDIGGDFIDGGFWKRHQLHYDHEQWTILLDTFMVSTGKTTIPFTRMRAPFLNKDQFTFKITQEGFMGSVSKFFGAQDIEIGDDFFDNQFIIQSNDRFKIKRLLNDQPLKTLIQNQPNIFLELREDQGNFRNRFPEGVNELYFQCRGIIKDKQVLKDLFDIFSIILSRLVQIDSAYEDDPNIVIDGES
ncbi:hypothetical protein [Acanthopleuribacter pedis]|uniref:DUF3137 domain-containing protein n=1 Tax=Acanthopleuribacter pedis TaxID=442870 RepID=A0A8J7U4G5_9BACT|nr:hypothetical protein [Acanthopleuribacter pedis]MBO1319408.1 hypothetical protein [Acanthopleuribacter pedis]